MTPQLSLPNATHLLAVAPTGSGKTTALAAPIAFSWPHSIVMLDIKDELFDLTATVRARRFGQEIVRLAPLGPSGRQRASHNYNLIGGIDPRSPYFLPYLWAVARAAVIRPDREGEGKHFADSAETWSVALLAATLRNSAPADRNLQTFRALTTDPGALVQTIRWLCYSDDEMLRRLGNQLLSYRDRELGSTLTTLNMHWNYLDQPSVATFTRASSSNFDARRLCDRRRGVTTYVTVPPQFLRSGSSQRLLRLIFTGLLRTVTEAGPDRTRNILFLLDEFPVLGKLEAVTDAVTQLRGYGIKIAMIVQALGQLKKCFPEGEDQVALANTDQLYFAARDQYTAEAIVAKLGQATVYSYNRQRSGGRSTSTTTGAHHSEQVGYNTGWTEGKSEVARPLLTAGEVMQLGERTAILFAQNMPPVAVQLVRWYEDPAFRGQGRSLNLREGLRCLTILLTALGLAVAAIMWAVLPPDPAVGPPSPVPVFQQPFNAFPPPGAGSNVPQRLPTGRPGPVTPPPRRW